MRFSEALSHIYEMRPHFVRIASCAIKEVRGLLLCSKKGKRKPQHFLHTRRQVMNWKTDNKEY